MKYIEDPKEVRRLRYLRRYAGHPPKSPRIRHYLRPQPPSPRWPSIMLQGRKITSAFSFYWLHNLFLSPIPPQRAAKQANLKQVGVGRGGIKMYREIAAPKRSKDYPRKSQ